MKFIVLVLLMFNFGFFYSAFSQEDIKEQVINAKELALSDLKNENYSKAKENILHAIQLLSQISDDQLKAESYQILADINILTDETSEAFQNYLRSSVLYKKIHQNESLSKVYFKLALIYFEEDAFNRSIDYLNLSDSLDPEGYKKYPENFMINEKFGDAFYNIGNIDKAGFYFDKLYQNSSENHDTSKLIVSYTKIFKVLKKEEQHKEALKMNHELFKIYKNIGDYNGQAITKNNIGYLYVNMSDLVNAHSSFKEAEAIIPKSTLGNKFHATILSNIGICLHNINEHELSIASFLKARNITEIEDDHRERAVINNILANIYFQKDDLYNATEYSLESIEDSKKANDPTVLKSCYKTYSNILQALDDYQKAMDYFKKHLELRDSLLVEKRMNEQKISQKIDELERSEKDIQVRMADEELREMLLKQMKLEARRRENELELLNKEKELAKSEKDMTLQSLLLERQKRDALIQEQQIKTLEYDKEVQDLELKQKEIEEKEKQKEIELLEIQNEKKELTIEKQDEVRKRFTWTFGFVLVILGLIIYSLISARKKNKKLKEQKKQIEQNNDELNQQNEEISSQKEYLELANTKISQQNDEITDSIKYAKRIQQAVLPPFDSKISNMLSDHFILYKPKDIVSGDFYWMKKIGENIVIAIADCTGHGVPGAFMSMLGVSYLNEVVSKTRFDNAGLILDRLRRKVIKTLGQTGKEFEQKDGMDMVLLIIDTENMNLQYAGANNPLLIFSEGKENIIKADRMPIGIHHNDMNFTNHIIDIKNGDVIYAYSDGYQDQFGGAKGKKFLTRRFRELLFDIHKKPMDKQKKILNDTLEDWQSFKDEEGTKFQQIDDILVMGVKI